MYVPQCVPSANGTCVGCPASQRKAEAHACACGDEQSVLCLSAGCVTRTCVDGEFDAGYTCSSGTVSIEPEKDDSDGVSDHAPLPVTYTSSANLVPEPNNTGVDASESEVKALGEVSAIAAAGRQQPVIEA
jgi:hypothetical protein